MRNPKKILLLRDIVFSSALLLALTSSHLRAEDTMASGTRPAKPAEPHYLAAHKPDAIALLAPPPPPGSTEQSADLAETIAVHTRYTSANGTPKPEPKLSVFAFTPAIGEFFQPGKLPKTEQLLASVREDAEIVEGNAKEYWKRPRPYTVDPSLARGANDLEKSFSYPSGHSTCGTVFALLLAELFPQKRQEILATGRDIGWHRVEIARHYPTDIYAGRVLAQAIVQELKASAKFREDFAKAQKEIAAGLTAANPPAQAAALAH
jgi:acid phosphatase (class A)